MDWIEFELYLNNIFEIVCFKDYCLNGLQVEGCCKIEKIVIGVMVLVVFFEVVFEWGVDVVFVYYGYFWCNEVLQIIGCKYQCLKLLFVNDLNLFVFYLLFDVYFEFGNNVQFGEKFGLIGEQWFGEGDFGWMVMLLMFVMFEYFVVKVENMLGCMLFVFGDLDMQLCCIVWCMGVVQSYFDVVIDVGVDVFLIGEVFELIIYVVVESGVVFVVVGYYVIECYGIQVFGCYLFEEFDFEYFFIDIYNLV